MASFPFPIIRFLWYVLLLLSANNKVLALDVVGSLSINSPVTWEATDSPVNVQGMIDIETDGVLTIASGVTVNFEDSSSGISNSGGTLLVLGDSNNRVQLQPKTNDFNWGGIKFEATAVAAFFEVTDSDSTYSSGSVIQYTDIHKAGSSSSGALDFRSGAAPYLLGVDIIECNGPSSHPLYVSQLQGFFVSKFLTIRKASEDSSFGQYRAIRIDGSGSDNGIVILENLDIGPVSQEALRVRNVAQLSIQDSVMNGFVSIEYVKEVSFVRNKVSPTKSGTAMNAYRLGGDGKLQVFEENTFKAWETGNHHAFYAYDWYESNQENIIQDNEFQNGRLYYYSRYYQRSVISDNTVRGSSYGAVSVQAPGQSEGDIVVANNTIQDCFSQYYHVISLIASGYAFNFENNEVSNCTGVKLLYLDGNSNYATASFYFKNNTMNKCTASSDLVYFENYPFTEFSGNVFVSSTAPTVVNFGGSFRLIGEDILLSLPANYWGDSQEDMIEYRAGVQDGLRSDVPVIVDFQRILSGPDAFGATQNVSIPGPFLADGSVGGYVQSGVVRFDENTEYSATLSLFITGDASLFIEPGVNMSFAIGASMKLFGDGPFTIEGTPTMPINFRGLDGAQWGGLVLESQEDFLFVHVNIEDAETAIDHKGTAGLLVSLSNIIGSPSSTYCVRSEMAHTNWAGPQTNITIDRSTITDCGVSGTAIRLNYQSTIRVTGCHITGGYLGIRTGSSTRDVVIVDNTIKNYESSGAYLYGGSSTNIDVVGNALSTLKQSAGGLYISCSRCKVNVTRNAMYGAGVADTSTSYEYPFYCYHSNSRGLYLGNNHFEGWNRVHRPGAYVYFSSSYAGVGLEMHGNRFANIIARNILELSYASTRRGLDIQNEFGSGLEATSSDSPSLFLIREWPPPFSSYSLPTLKGTLFTGNLRNDTEQYYIEVLENADQTPEIDISESYWNTDDVIRITETIKDGVDQLGVSILNFNPFLDAVNGSLINGTIPFLKPGNVLGGTLEEGDVVILPCGNYTAESSLNINGRLVLEPGVVLKLPVGAGILVRSGTLDARGTVDKPIVFERLEIDDSPWSQIYIGPGQSSQGELVMEYVRIQGAGQSNVPALLTERGGNYTNITIEDCIAGGLRVDANSDNFLFDGLVILDGSTSRYYHNVYLSGEGDVTIQDATLSSQGSSEIYTTGNIRVWINRVHLQPRYQGTYGLQIRNRFTEVDSLSYDVSFISYRTGPPVYVDNAYSDFTIRNSQIDAGDGSSEVLRYYAYWTGASLLVENTDFTGESASRGLYVSGIDVTLVNNTFSGIDTSYQALYAATSGHFIMEGNVFQNVVCGRTCIETSCQKTQVSNNDFVNLQVNGASYSLFSTSRDERPVVLRNRWIQCKGSHVYGFNQAQSLDFADNAVVNITQLDKLVITTTPFDDVDGGVYYFGTNYWGTIDFDILRAKTIDSSTDASIATIQYPRIYIDESLTASIAAPPPGAIVDFATHTVGGTILDGSIVLVPAGLYLATSPIILNHPDAELVLEAGAQIMFAESGSIEVRQGTFKCVGTSESPVELVSTHVYADEYGSSFTTIDEPSTRWGGIRFSADAASTTLLDAQYVEGPILKHCHILNAGNAPLDAAVVMDQTSVMLEHVLIHESVQNGVYISGSSGNDMVWRHVNITSSENYGFWFYNYPDPLFLLNVNITGSGYEGAYLHLHGNVRIANSYFAANHYSQIRSNAGTGFFNVSSSFVGDGLDDYGVFVANSRYPTGMGVSIVDTEFARLKRPLVVSGRNYDGDAIEVVLSTFVDSVCSDSSCVAIDLTSYRTIEFRGNRIHGNIASTVARFVGVDTYNFYGIDDGYPLVSITGNVFSSNRAATSTSGQYAVVSLVPYHGPASVWDVQGNEFSNPLSLLEVTLAEYSGNQPEASYINGTNNLFGFMPNPTADDVGQKIYDNSDNAAIPSFDFEPFLSSDYVPSCVSNCTDRGTCTFPGYCICEPGWGGESCETPTCQDLAFCNGHGDCVDFDTCACQDGWLGEACSTADCSERSECNGNGVCNVPNSCTCDIGYAGEDCDVCVESYRLVDATCLPCPICSNDGYCDAVEPRCICPPNYAGDWCNACADGFFAYPACQAIPFVEFVFPNEAVDLGGVTIHLQGLNFESTSPPGSAQCIFGGLGGAGIVPATMVDDELECTTPTVDTGSNAFLSSSLRVKVDGVLSYNSVPFTFYGQCPEGSCVNGFCSFGRCQCTYGYTGGSCEEALVAPVVQNVPSITSIPENDPFQYQFFLLEGTTPISWSLVGSNRPATMALNSTTGLLTWQVPVASVDVQSFQVRAENTFGSATLVLNLHVTPSYIVEVVTSTISRFRPSPPFPFNIRTLHIDSLQPVGNKLATFWIREEGSTFKRRTTVKTGADGRFTRNFLPYGSDAGFFEYGGEHPNYTNNTAQGFFAIRGIDADPPSLRVNGLSGENLTLDAFAFALIGGNYTGLSVDVGGDEGLSVSHYLSVADSTASLSVHVISELSIFRRLSFTIKSDEGDSKTVYLDVDIRDRTPRINVASPVTIDIKIARNGGPRYVDVVLENIGSLASGPIEVDIPPQPLLSSASGDVLSGIPVDGKQTLSLQIAATPDMELGTYFYGTMVFKTDGSPNAALQYRVTVVSSVPASLTVLTENEATYFAEDTPNLADVDVRLRSLTQGTSTTLNSGPEGNVTFSDLVEDVYEIYAQAPKHAPFRTTIFLQAPGQTVRAFLQAQVVSYTFTVVPVEIVDSYIIEVEATFDTFVPAPVIVWTPARPDWQAIENGLLTEFEITGENRGLISVENVTLSWPRRWRNVEFVFPDDLEVNENDDFFLGDLPANTSVTIPVRVIGAPAIEIPDDRILKRVGRGGVLLLDSNDPRWTSEPGPSVIVVSPHDPTDRMYMQWDLSNQLQWYYNFTTMTLYTPVYDGDDVVDYTVTENADFPDDSNRRELVVSDLSGVDPFQRQLMSVGCAWKSFLTGMCYGNFPPGVASLMLSGLCNANTFADLLKAAAALANYFCGGPRVVGHNFGAPADDPGLPDCGSSSGPSGPGSVPGSGPGSGPASGGGDGYYGGGSPFCKGLAGLGGGRRELTEGFSLSDDLSGGLHETTQGFDPPSDSSLFLRILEDTCPTCPDSDLATVFQEVRERELLFLSVETALDRCISVALSEGGLRSLFQCVVKASVGIADLMPLLLEVSSCELEQTPCLGDLSTRPGQQNLLIQAARIQSLAKVLLLPFGSILANATDLLIPYTEDSFVGVAQIQAFDSALAAALDSNGDNADTISENERNVLINVGLDAPSPLFVDSFVVFWNRSLGYWDSGIFSASDLEANDDPSFLDLNKASQAVQKYQESRSAVRREGFNGLGDAWRNAVEGQQYEEARRLAGVCASVRVSITQELTLTRIGFEARLEITNDGTFPLKDLSVVLRVNPFQNFEEDSTELFVFGDPKLYEVTAVDGSGVLAPETSGEVTWLIIPLNEAAPVFETLYDVGGILQYKIDGVEYIQNLAADTITVRPDPQLYLTYFWSRTVYADDPFTPEIFEPSVPFQLAVLIENRGYGDAYDLNIASSQPIITENEKGLLVDFTIVGARLGNEPTSSTLSVDFGTVEAQSNTVGVWDIVSTLRGTFSNFTAIYTYNGPIDDNRLSLIESVGIFELKHLVRVTGDHPGLGPNSLGYLDDGLDDFLVNVNPDAFYIPDTVFTSDTRDSNYSVASVIDKAIIGEPVHDVFGRVVVVEVEFNLTSNEYSLLSDWVYIRFDDPMARSDYVLQSATRLDFDYKLIEQANSWQTSWTDYLVGGAVEELDYIHLFDAGVATKYRLEYRLQQPVGNLVVVEEADDSISIAWDRAPGASSSYIMIKPTGYGDQYFQVAKDFTQVESQTLANLQSGTSYTIRVYTGDFGMYETTGAQVIGTTLGNSTCGDGNVDVGEECDDGIQNELGGNCTAVCFIFRDGPQEETSRSPSPSNVPSSAPSTSLSPSSNPSALPSFSQQPSASVAPSSDNTTAPSLSLPPRTTISPSHSPSALPSRSLHPSVTPSGSPSAAPSLSLQPTAEDPVETENSEAPSASPSDSSNQPSQVPTSQPTNGPSSRPSQVPTSQLSQVPTSQPSQIPTSQPSQVPTSQPSNSPTRQPTSGPTLPPTLQPTRQPVVPQPVCGADECNGHTWIHKMRDVNGEEQCDVQCSPSKLYTRIKRKKLGFSRGCCPPGSTVYEPPPRPTPVPTSTPYPTLDNSECPGLCEGGTWVHKPYQAFGQDICIRRCVIPHSRTARVIAKRGFEPGCSCSATSTTVGPPPKGDKGGEADKEDKREKGVKGGI